MRAQLMNQASQRFRVDLGMIQVFLALVWAIWGAWWTSSEQDSLFSYIQSMDYSVPIVHGEPDPKNRGFSVRCVKDY